MNFFFFGKKKSSLEKNILDSLIFSVKNLGVIIYDQNFKILYINNFFKKFCNLPDDFNFNKKISINDESVSSIFKEIIYPSLAPKVVKISDNYPQIISVTTSDNKSIEVIINPIKEDGDVIGFIKIVEDKTNELNLKNAKTEFLEIAAHNLRTPITSLKWALDSITTEDSSSQDFLNIARQSGDNLLNIVNDIINASEIEEGKFSYEFENIDIIPIIKNLIKEAELISLSYKIKIYFNSDKNSLFLDVDKRRIKEALGSLLENAIKYNIKDGSVEVGVKDIDDFVVIGIKDTGLGIPEKDQDKIFTKFYRAENAVKTVNSGSGLGLYLVKNIINSHKGNIWFESKEGRGTTFFIKIPKKQ